jgi:hypothetical protein
MPLGRDYPSPKAFRQALTDKLRAIEKDSRWTLAQLQRQIAFDRLLERLYLIDEGWVVKGATALLARDLGVRGTLDIDLYREVTLEVAERELREAAAKDIGDWFVFELAAGTAMSDGASGQRVPVTASIGATTWVDFRVDLVGPEVRMTGTPEPAPALARVMMPTVEQRGYRVYPLVDHVADKVCAICDRYGTNRVPSTRYKDLVDLVAISTAASVPAGAQSAALDSEGLRRAIRLPERFRVPDRELWETGYAAEAARSLLPVAHSLDEALALVRPFLDPLLDGTATGNWDPNTGEWI